MTQVKVAGRIHCQQPDASTARQRLAPALMQICHQLVHVREPIVLAAQRLGPIVLPEAFERAMNFSELRV